jgi:hypothetical protein
LREGKGEAGMNHVSQRRKQPFHDSRALKMKFHVARKIGIITMMIK